MHNEISDIIKKYGELNEQDFMKNVNLLPTNMQEQVKTCFAAAKVKGKKGRRYSTEWIYECFLLRVKGRASYEFLRQKNIMPLPTIPTLNKYIKNMKPTYGFHEEVFKCLRTKTQNFDDSELHGEFYY